MTLRKMARGQSAVELALGLPFLAVLLFVVCEFARVFYVAMGVASAARAGVQYGAQSYVKAIDNSGMTLAADNDGKNISGLSVTPTHFCMCDGAQCSPAQASACVVSCSRAALDLHRTQGLRQGYDQRDLPNRVDLGPPQ